MKKKKNAFQIILMALGILNCCTPLSLIATFAGTGSATNANIFAMLVLVILGILFISWSNSRTYWVTVLIKTFGVLMLGSACNCIIALSLSEAIMPFLLFAAIGIALLVWGGHINTKHAAKVKAKSDSETGVTSNKAQLPENDHTDEMPS